MSDWVFRWQVRHRVCIPLVWSAMWAHMWLSRSWLPPGSWMPKQGLDILLYLSFTLRLRCHVCLRILSENKYSFFKLIISKYPLLRLTTSTYKIFCHLNDNNVCSPSTETMWILYEILVGGTRFAFHTPKE